MCNDEGMEQGNLEFESFNDRIHNQRVLCIFVAIVLCSHRITEENVIVVETVAYWCSAENQKQQESCTWSKHL